MLSQFIPPAVMFAVTVIFTTLFFLPMTMFQQSNKVANFYWSGLWVFLALIAGLSGGSNTLMLARIDGNATMTHVILTSVMAAFVLFVVFGWFRLSGKAVLAFIRHLRRSRA